MHPLSERELRALNALSKLAKSAYLFESERNRGLLAGPMQKRNAQHIIEKARRDAGLPFRAGGGSVPAEAASAIRTAAALINELTRTPTDARDVGII